MRRQLLLGERRPAALGYILRALHLFQHVKVCRYGMRKCTAGMLRKNAQKHNFGYEQRKCKPLCLIIKVTLRRICVSPCMILLPATVCLNAAIATIDPPPPAPHHPCMHSHVAMHRAPDSKCESFICFKGTNFSLSRFPLHPVSSLCCLEHDKLQVRRAQPGQQYLAAAAAHTSQTLPEVAAGDRLVVCR